MNACLACLFGWFGPYQVGYDEANRRAQTFDLVYYFDVNTWTQPLVSLFGGKLITHMGMLWRHPATRQLYVLESVRHNANIPDIAAGGRVHAGVRLVPFDRSLADSNIFVCVQTVTMETECRRQATLRLDAFIQRWVGTPFDDHLGDYFFNQLPASWFPNRHHENTSSLFCSETVALALRECDLLHGVENVSEVWPSMFWDGQFELAQGAVLTRSRYMVRPRPLLAITTTPLPPPAITTDVASIVDRISRSQIKA